MAHEPASDSEEDLAHLFADTAMLRDTDRVRAEQTEERERGDRFFHLRCSLPFLSFMVTWVIL
jgi:hypothetical protein